MKFKIAFIGAGSITFSRKLVADLLTVPEFADIEIAFHDIDEKNLDRVARLCQRDIEANKLNIHITSHTDRREAVKGARYVLNVVRIGGLEAFEHDINIPLKYGVDQCVGDTLGPGGIFYAQRVIPFLLDLCANIRELAEPDCLLLNYSNPMAMATWAAIKYGGVRTVGLCHGVQHGVQLFAKLFKVPYEDLDIVCAGINHQTWYIGIKHAGSDLTGKLLEAFEAEPYYLGREKVRVDMLRRFGYFSTESNGHLSEYLPWYRKDSESLKKWISDEGWALGRTGGYLGNCHETRNQFDEKFDDWMSEPEKTYSPDQRSIEHGSYIIESLETGRIYRGHFNQPNFGVITNLPSDCIIEAPGYVDANGIHMPRVGELPLGCAAVCNASVSVQRLSVEAAVHGDFDLLRQALMMDPLTAAVLEPPQIWSLAQEMLDALGEWMPQYNHSARKTPSTQSVPS